jgi:hypothetical protein
VVEVSNYVAALDHGLSRLRGGFPLSNRLIREIHGVLLSRGRGSGKDPGVFRRSRPSDRPAAPAVSSAMNLLTALGIVREMTGKRRNRLFIYTDYLNRTASAFPVACCGVNERTPNNRNSLLSKIPRSLLRGSLQYS